MSRMSFKDGLIDRIRAGVIGDDLVMETPYGRRRIIYADYTASGRSLRFVEEAILEQVLPRYANTHTESSGTGLQTTTFREDARQIVRGAIGAGDDVVVLFCGSGSTGAIDKLVNILGFRIPSVLEDRYRLSRAIPPAERPVVFIGPFEHHSNELPWRESIAEVVTIPEDLQGHVDLTRLEQELRRYAARPRKIGSFSAASNVTGILTDTAAVARLLHAHGALSFWDFAAAAPYLDVAMSAGDGAHKDAVFLSPHKFVGGPQTPGVLAVRRDLVDNRVPVVPGGGTVAYVNPVEHRYVEDVVTREEGGTPAIVEAIRCGLVFQLKQAVGADAIREREEEHLRKAVTSWTANPWIEVLGNPEADRLSIVSFVVRAPSGGYVHHNFVVALLNDLFGIQARGGCSCAGPYGHRLLGIDLDRSHAFERQIALGCEGIKPGWVRVNFNYFVSPAVVDYVIEAVNLVADRGWRLLGDYRFDPATGRWRHRLGPVSPPLRLTDVRYATDGGLVWCGAGAGSRAGAPTPETAADDALDGYLAEARAILAGAATTGRAEQPASISEGFDALRWFELPAVCLGDR